MKNTVGQKPSNCSKIISRGYKKSFCEYDAKYSYKAVAFETKYQLLVTLYSLKPNPHHSYVYNVQDEQLKFWSDVHFDKCSFRFSHDDKLSEVYLSLSALNYENGKSQNQTQNLQKIEIVQSNLTRLFGTPDKKDGKENTLFCWFGENLTLILYVDKIIPGVASVLIGRNNEKKIREIDDL